MLLTPSPVLAQAFGKPDYFESVVLILLGSGAFAWLVASLIGFSRLRAFGASTKWFTLCAVCLLLYHLQFLVFVVIAVAATRSGGNSTSALGFAAFFNLFVFLGAVCAIMGFIRLTDHR